MFQESRHDLYVRNVSVYPRARSNVEDNLRGNPEGGLGLNAGNLSFDCASELDQSREVRCNVKE